jgi:hypothetical protein
MGALYQGLNRQKCEADRSLASGTEVKNRWDYISTPTYVFVGNLTLIILLTALHIVNPFQFRDAIWHHTFNSVLHMLQFFGAGKGLVNPFQPKKIVAFFGMERVNPFQPPKIVAYEGQN